MSMALDKEKNIINVIIPNSEASISGQMIGIKDSDVAGFYTNDKEELKQEIYDFFKDDFEYFISVIDLNIMLDEIDKNIYPTFKDVFKNKMSTFEKDKIYFNESNDQLLHIPKMFFGGQDGRYLKFKNDDELIKRLRGVLFGGITGFIVEKNADRYIIHPYLRDNWLEEIRKKEVLLMNIAWIISANSSIYDHEQAFIDNGYVDWEQRCNYKIGDICYIYVSNPTAKIKYKTIVEKVDIPLSQVNDDNYWKGDTNYNPNMKFARLKLVKEVDDEDDSLTYSRLKDHGLLSQLQSPIKLEGDYLELKNYIESVFNLYYTKEDFLNEVFIDDEKEYDKLCTLLKNKKNIILQGSPGVGKTFMARRLAYSIIGKKNKDQILSIQFHQSYSYEDFIEGIRPNENGEFKTTSGMFKDFVNEKALKNPGKDYFVIIDEINRGNLSKILGELMKLIEFDKRYDFENEDYEYAILPYSKEEFKIPKNVYIIGTMNTADRSLAMVDYALRRRFAFYPVKPAFNSSKFVKWLKNRNGIREVDINDLVTRMNNVNSMISNDLGRGFEIGHSYFIDTLNPQDYRTSYNYIIEYEIMPQLEEYYLDEDTKLDDYRKIL